MVESFRDEQVSLHTFLSDANHFCALLSDRRKTQIQKGFWTTAASTLLCAENQSYGDEATFAAAPGIPLRLSEVTELQVPQRPNGDPIPQRRRSLQCKRPNAIRDCFYLAANTITTRLTAVSHLLTSFTFAAIKAALVLMIGLAGRVLEQQPLQQWAARRFTLYRLLFYSTVADGAVQSG